MNKKVTMESIANELGITKNTVSLALRNMPGVSEKTRRLVIKTAQQNGYKYKNSLDTVNNCKAKNICLMLSDDTRSSVDFFSFIQYGIESKAKENNLNTILHCFDEKKDFEVPLCIKDGIISGIITLGRLSPKTLKSIIALDVPLVVIDHFFDDVKASYILSDNVSGGYIATEHLINSGHREIGFCGNIFSSSSFFDRYLGYLKALTQYKIDVNPLYSITDTCMAEMSSHKMIIEKLEEFPSFPTAMFCCNDIEAISIIKALSLMGISVPDDISIIGFDDIELSKNISPELTTMHICKELLGERAVKKLTLQMTKTDYTKEKILLPANLVERQSVKNIVTIKK
ncbi:LacI family DNA-binding transcriptional regulator [Herbivorax sp. ANBcel31]|uniref:LacI family DNA-binding transcriptional regulator n=1 Tax=Herbivorax sp. ANBcel31 TaxID=3069754 RepID=UPI0027B7DD2F|nr:LacI family DNA-binding transcriptional regulator [Herbivorax sp. ANBcel31]MDQ2086861.1 LacI family DNA-binding transcriptional regulator [Herbivorax sp. ANBcel31]